MTPRRLLRRGANAIEFGLTLPAFLAIVMGIIDFGYYFSAQAILDAAALEGTRQGALTDPALADPVAEGKARMEEVATLICPNCAYTCIDRPVQTATSNQTIRELECTVTWNFTPLVGMLPMPNTVSATTRQQLEWQRAY